MKLLIVILFITFVTVLSCHKDNYIEIVKVQFIERPLNYQRVNGVESGFNGATSISNNGITSFQSTFNKSNSKCETFGDFAGVQAFIRDRNILGLDYSISKNTKPINSGYAPLLRINRFRWYFHHIDAARNVQRWRIEINDSSIAEYDVVSVPNQAYVGFGMCEGVLHDVTWQPAFIFNGNPTDNIKQFWFGPKKITIDEPKNTVIGSER